MGAYHGKVTFYYKDGQIYNDTNENGLMTSSTNITKNPEKAFFSRDGDDLNEPDWKKVEE